MRRTTRTLLIRLSILASLACVWSFSRGAQTAPEAPWQWFKGNLHTHTINSDGDSAPDAVARWYKEHRYNFLVLTDHNFLTEPEGLNAVFAAGGKFLLIPGEEVTARYEEIPIHVNAFDIRSTILPPSGTSVLDTVQKNVDAIRQAGGMPSLNHPNFHWAVRPAELRQVNGLKLFEVYNGHPVVNNWGGEGFESLDEMWDIVLSAGREVYGIAVDDAHHFKTLGPEFSNPGRGWVMVKARELTTRAVLDALERGDFYASTGVELEEVERLDRGLRIKIAKPRTVRFTTDFIGADGKLLSRSFDNPAEYQLAAGDRYVRARVTDSNGRQAWVQPVFAR
jgi:predicted metal-dependent phosphoesterase TrpH